MTADNFFYWLQGYFELVLHETADAPHSITLTPTQATCIGRHIDLVVAWHAGGQRRVQTPVPERVIEIRALLRMYNSAPELVSTKVRELVADQFQHVIDLKATPEEQAKFNKIHGGVGKEPVYRC